MTQPYLLILLLASVLSTPIQLKVIVTNIQTGRRRIVVDIYNSKESFFKEPAVSKTLKADTSQLELSFDLSEDEYAIAAYQDINENGVLDKGLFNIPKEPYGLSNNVRPKWSAPKWDDCKFNLTRNMVSRIILK